MIIGIDSHLIYSMKTNKKNVWNCYKTFIFLYSQSEFEPDDFSLHFFIFVIYSYFRLISLIENACKWTTPWNALFVQNFMVKWALSQTITGQNVKKCGKRKRERFAMTANSRLLSHYLSLQMCKTHFNLERESELFLGYFFVKQGVFWVFTLDYKAQLAIVNSLIFLTRFRNQISNTMSLYVNETRITNWF